MKPSTSEIPSVQALFDLRGRVAAVTGGAGYLGPVLAGALAEAGARVAILDLNQDKSDATASAIQARTGIECLGVATDVTSSDAVKRACATVVRAFQHIDILVTAVYGKSPNFYAPFEACSLAEWEQVLRVNLTGTFLCCQAFGRQMVEQGGGSIVNVASFYGVVPPDHRIYEGSNLAQVYVGGASATNHIASPAAYSVSKAGIVMLTRYLATYWADRGVRVNAISPGGVFHPGENEEFLRRYSDRTPMGRKAWPYELKGAVAFLASEASSYITGQNLIIDGGWTVW